MNTIYKFDGAVVWLNGTSLAGEINEIELPEISWDVIEHETIALIGTPEFANKLEAMESTITWASYSPDLAEAAANAFRSVNLQIRASAGQYTANGKTGDISLKIDLTGRFKNNQMGTFSPGEMERESVMTVDFVSEKWNNTEILAIGINPPIYRVRGRDLLEGMRRNLGG
ncbi:phage major tail tube protein [Leptolyngbya ohadii]|uniref:phage major tail tube protein n=1 Tax=Leptolyngbya ohadii TaxID=1962290 RepID=UPI0015C5A572|nr:phage major tail tube protein [Leptolyngbya ohadii]